MPRADVATAEHRRGELRTSQQRYRMMRLSRRFEETMHDQFGDGAVPGPLHLSIGQEAVAVGGCASLRHERRRALHPPRSRPLPRQGRDAGRG